MKKVFISQPINGKGALEIYEARCKAMEEIKDIMNENVEIIDSWISEDPPVGVNPVIWYLGEALKRLAKADYIYMAEGWKDYRGCVIEHDVALKYGLNIIRPYEGSDLNVESSGN